MSDVLITRDGPYDTPYSYELGAREAFEPTTVEGLVDGAGAGGDFKIVCVIRSPDGKVLARVPTSETFSPGDEVAVTFAPFLRGTPSTPTTTQSWLRVVCDTAVPSGTIPILNGTVPTIGDFNTNDTARFVQTDASHWTMTRGVYIVNGEVIVSGGAVTVVNGDFCGSVISGGGFVAQAFFGNGQRAEQTSFSQLTIGDQSSLASWHGVLSGADTHAWSVHAYIVHVLGT